MISEKKKESGEIIYVNDGLEDVLKGFIKTDAGEIIPFYHPKCEKFYIYEGKRCRFHVDQIGLIISLPPQDPRIDAFVPPNASRIQARFSAIENFIPEEHLNEYTQVVQNLSSLDSNSSEEQYNEVVNVVENELVTILHSERVKKKVAVDLEEPR